MVKRKRRQRVRKPKPERKTLKDLLILVDDQTKELRKTTRKLDEALEEAKAEGE